MSKLQHDARPRSEGSTARLQALADGVFAVAMTVLALGLPDGAGTAHPVSAVLRAGLPHLLLYFVSMLALGALWFGHRNTYEYVVRTDHPHTWLSLATLTFIPLVPWSVSVLAAHVTNPLALTVYNANLVIISALDAIAWWYAVDGNRLTDRLPPEFAKVSTRLAAVPAIGFLLAIGLAWLSAPAALAIDVALPLLPVSGVSYRLQYWLSRRRRRPVRGGPARRA